MAVTMWHLSQAKEFLRSSDLSVAGPHCHSCLLTIRLFTLTSWSCHNKSPQAWWLQAMEIYCHSSRVCSLLWRGVMVFQKILGLPFLPSPALVALDSPGHGAA
jgi:hypothetical protein